MCNCNVCTDTRRWRAALNPATPEAEAMFDELMGRLEAAETDAVYWELKFKSQWPSDKPEASQP